MPTRGKQREGLNIVAMATISQELCHSEHRVSRKTLLNLVAALQPSQKNLLKLVAVTTTRFA